MSSSFVSKHSPFSRRHPIAEQFCVLAKEAMRVADRKQTWTVDLRARPALLMPRARPKPRDRQKSQAPRAVSAPNRHWLEGRHPIHGLSWLNWCDRIRGRHRLDKCHLLHLSSLAPRACPSPGTFCRRSALDTVTRSKHFARQCMSPHLCQASSASDAAV